MALQSSQVDASQVAAFQVAAFQVAAFQVAAFQAVHPMALLSSQVAVQVRQAYMVDLQDRHQVGSPS